MFGYYLPVFLLAREVVPLVVICGVVIELLAPIGVPDVAPALRPHRVVVLLEGGQGGPRPLSPRIIKQGFDADALEPLSLPDATELDERWEHLDKFYGPGAPPPLQPPGKGNNHRDVGGGLPQALLGPALFFSKVKAVVREQHNDRILRVDAFLERIEHPAELGVHEADTGEISLYSRLPLVGFDKPVMRRGIPVGGELPGKLGKIRPVIELDLWQSDLAKRMQFEPFPRRVERHMRPVETKGYEEGLGVLPVQLVDDPARILVIVALVAPIVLRPKIPERLSFTRNARLDPLSLLVPLPRGRTDDVKGPLLRS